MPGWLKVVDNKVVEVPDKVEIIRRIFSMSLSGVGMLTVCKTLNGEFVPSFKNAGWSIGTIKKILNNIRVVGG